APRSSLLPYTTLFRSEADKAKDVKKLAPRVVGSAADFRKSAYAMIKKAKEWADELHVPGETIIVPMTSVDSEFPRVAVVLVEDEIGRASCREGREET